jgi:lysophospholipase L1-like esterase
MLLRQRLACEIGIVGKGGLGYQSQSGTFQGGATANPAVTVVNGAGETYLSHFYNGRARTWLTTHTYIFIQLGANGSTSAANVQDTWSYLRTNAGSGFQGFQVIDPVQAARATILSASLPDATVDFLDFGATLYSGASTPSPDGSHMNAEGHARWSNNVAWMAEEKLAGGGGGSGAASIFGGSVVR